MKCYKCLEEIIQGHGCESDNDKYRMVWDNEIKTFIPMHLFCWTEDIINKMSKKNENNETE